MFRVMIAFWRTLSSLLDKTNKVGWMLSTPMTLNKPRGEWKRFENTSAVVKIQLHHVFLTSSLTRQYYLVDGSETHAQEVISWNILSRFLWFLQPELPQSLIFETLWVLTNVAAGPTAHTNIIVELGFLPYLIHLLSHPLISIRTQVHIFQWYASILWLDAIAHGISIGRVEYWQRGWRPWGFSGSGLERELPGTPAQDMGRGCGWHFAAKGSISNCHVVCR